MKNKSSNRLTKYERSKILGARAIQISMGSPLMINDLHGETDPIKIAELELRQRKIPMIIKRTLPDGTVEMWELEDMIIE